METRLCYWNFPHMDLAFGDVDNNQIIFHKAIAPEFFPNMIEYSVSKGNSREVAENYFNLSSYILQSIFGTLSFGVVISAIVALILQTKNKK